MRKDTLREKDKFDRKERLSQETEEVKSISTEKDVNLGDIEAPT